MQYAIESKQVQASNNEESRPGRRHPIDIDIDGVNGIEIINIFVAASSRWAGRRNCGRLLERRTKRPPPSRGHLIRVQPPNLLCRPPRGYSYEWRWRRRRRRFDQHISTRPRPTPRQAPSQRNAQADRVQHPPQRRRIRDIVLETIAVVIVHYKSTTVIVWPKRER